MNDDKRGAVIGAGCLRRALCTVLNNDVILVV